MIYIGCHEAMEAIRTAIVVAKHRHHAKVYICANLAQPVASAAAQLWVRAHLKNSLVRPGTELFSRNATLLALRLADLGRRDAKRHRRFEMTQLLPFVREVEYTFVQI